VNFRRIKMEKTHIREGYGRNHLVFFGDHCVQAIERDRDIWFLVSDLGRMLELTNIKKNLQELKDDEKDMCYMWVEPKWPDPFKDRKILAQKVPGATIYEARLSETKRAGVTFSYSRGQKRRVRVVNEAGLYRLVFMSRTPMAKRFQDWAVRDVFPVIRKTGQYKRRETVPGVFMPKDMTELQMTKINLRERPCSLRWIEPCAVPSEEQAAINA
jgi:prophage antirepressor-like protein